MTTLKTLCMVLLVIFLLAGCNSASSPLTPTEPTSLPQAGQQAAQQQTATPAPTTAPFPQGISNEPLAIVTTQPADMSEEVNISKDATQIVAQFNHPVVPLVTIDQQQDLPKPLTIQPALAGDGKWINTSTFVFTPSQNLGVATLYTVRVSPLKDMLGQSLSDLSWTFKTSSPAVLKTSPADNSRYVGVTQPISATFNTEMDRASVESRFVVKRQDSNFLTLGKLSWQGTVVTFVPEKPLDYGAAYSLQVKSGAQDANKLAQTAKDYVATFRTSDRPAVRSTSPKDGEQNGSLENGFRVEFASPMKRDSLKVTIQPTITEQSVWWENDGFGKTATSIAAHIGGGWLASKAYTVTISGESQTQFGEKLDKDTVVRFTAAPREPSLYLNVPGNISMYDANSTPTIVASVVNVNRIDYKLYKVDRTEFISMVGRNFYQALNKYAPKDTNLVRSWSSSPKLTLNATTLVSSTLTADSSVLAPGIYFLQSSSPSVVSRNGPGQNRYMFVVTGLNLAFKRTETESLVWVTDLKSGQPVADQPLAIYDTNGTVIGSGKSDKSGVWRATFKRQNAWDPTFVLSESGGRIMGATGSDWNNGVMSWDYGLPSQPQANDYYANLYTDRSIYRPGQSVFYRGILRSDNDAQYSLPQGLENVLVTVRDDQGKQISTQTVTLSRFGTFNGEIKLSEAASIGYYNLNLEVGKDPRKFNSSVGFQVAEYRRPEFQVNTATDKPEYVNGQTIKFDVDSTYFFGGPVRDADVKWRLLADDYFFSAPNVKGWWDFTDYDLSEARQRQGGVIREGKGKTDSAGRFSVQVPADLKEYPLSQNFTLEAEITDVNNQSVSARTVVPVHKGAYYIGLRPQKYVGTVNQEQAADIITVDPDGNPAPNQDLTISFYEHKWYSVREKSDDGGLYWKSAYTDTLVSRVTVKTDAQGAAVAKFTPSAGGVFKIVGEGQDASKNTVRSATYLWVSGRDFVNWRMENNDRIDLVADKKEYAPGDTAEVLIPAPFKNAEALLTIERGSIRTVQRLTLASNSERVRIPIQPDYAPNVFVSVMIVKGRAPDSPTPQFKMGYTNLAVSTVEKQLKISVTPDKSGNYQPRQNATFSIQAADNTGKPVEAEFSVALVDKAIQSLVDDLSQSPLKAFYGQRGLGVQTAATLIRSVDRINQTLTPEAKGGGGGLPDQTVRRDFKDTAFWKADVVTDSSGRAQISIPLPDNLTTWNLTTKGVTANTFVGVGSTDVVSSKDLIVRPVTPRFFVVGDKVRIEAVVNNNTDKDVSTDVRLDAKGLTLTGNAQQPLTVKAQNKAKVGWDTTVGPVEQVTVKFSAVGAGLEDATELAIPVERPISYETVGTAGQVDTKTAEQIQLPSTIDKNAGELRVELSPSLAAASRDSLKYIDSFEYECSEQTVSKFLPNVASYNALKKLGIDRPDLKAGLESNVTREVQRLYALQHQDGGWGWWLNDESRPTLTAYALLGLFTARDAGFAVDRDVMTRAEQFLNQYLDKPINATQSYAVNERAFVLFVLTEMGRNQNSRAISLFDQRNSLQIYGKALLLMALQKQKQPQATTLASEIVSAAIQSASGAHWEESKTDYYTMNTNTRTTALAIMALSRTGQGTASATVANGVRWLMVARKEGHWATTQETAWSVLALTEFMQSTGELQANYAYRVVVNNKNLGDFKADRTNVDQTVNLSVAVKDLVVNAANQVVISRDPGDGKLYYSAYLNYYLPVENVIAMNRGIIVARQYEALDPQTLKPTGKLVSSAKVGDYVQVRLTIVAPNDLYYLILEDPLPAGFEAVDTTLKTSSSAASGPALNQKQDTGKASDYWSRPYWYYWADSEVRDDKVAAFSTFLSRGTYEYTYTMRASVSGEFRTLPARAWEMYFPDVFGRSSGNSFTVVQ